MERTLRYKHEMLVRVRDFGAAHAELFPESSPGGQKFARVSAAVAAIEEHLKNRALGKAGSRAVNSTTREAVVTYMKAIAKAARRLARRRQNVMPFVLPRQRTLKVEVATAKAFLEEAEQRQTQFVEMGLPATFVSDFRSLVDELAQAVDGRLNSKTLRGTAQAGIALAVREGLETVRDLELVVQLAAGQDDLLWAAWRVARHIEGLKRDSADTAESTEASSPDQPSADQTMAADAASPPAAAEVTPDSVTTVQAPALVLEKAS